MAEDRMSKPTENAASSRFQPWTSPRPVNSKGLRITRTFSTPDVHPFEEIEWEKREARITDDNGKVIFEQKDVEVPVFWSQLATKVVVSKYFYGDLETGEREYSVKQLVHRVCRTIADRGRKDGYFTTDEDTENFYKELIGD